MVRFVYNGIRALLFLMLTSSVLAQQGHLYLSNYQPSIRNINSRNVDVVQGPDGVLYFANPKGILTYDGNQWDIIQTPSSVYALAVNHSTNDIWVGCKNNFGQLTTNKYREKIYISLSDDIENFGEITEIKQVNNEVYFYSHEALILFEASEDSVKHYWRSQVNHRFTGILKANKQLYLNIAGMGLHSVQDSLLTLIEGGADFADEQIITSFPYQGDTILFGTNSNNIYSFWDEHIQPYHFEAKEYLLESILTGGLSIDEDRFVLSTLAGGCIFIEKETGRTLDILNYQTGLPDDEIYALGKDRNGGLWITHGYGITRADHQLPIRKFSSYPGLEGNITTLSHLDSILYVGTNKGVFQLNKVTNFKELQVYIKRPDKKTAAFKPQIKRSPQIQKQKEKKEETEPISPDTSTQKEEKKKKGFRLFGYKIVRDKKKKDEKEEQAQHTTQQSTEQSSPTPPRPSKPIDHTSHPRLTTPRTPNYQVKKVYALQSVKHVFKQVNGLKGKCIQFLPWRDQLLVASNTGLYTIRTNEAEPIINAAYIYYLHKIDDHKFLAGLQEGVRLFYFQEGRWEVENPLPKLKSTVYSIAQDKNDHLWFGSKNIIYRLTYTPQGNQIHIHDTFSISKDFSESVTARVLHDQPYFFTSSETYTYQPDSGEIIKVNSISSEMTFQQSKKTWIYQNYNWVGLYQHKNDTLSNPYLKVFDDVQNIYVGPTGHFWVIDQSTNLYKITNRTTTVDTPIFEVILSKLRNNKEEPLPFDDLRLDYQQSSVHFRLQAPFFINEQATRYQYYLPKLMADWSPWQTDPTFSFPVLPSGKHTIKVRAKNVFGTISDEKSFTFRVSPPFWQTWWFYLSCLVLAGGVVYGFIKIRERNLKRRQKILEEKVELRTAELKKKNKNITASINYAKRIQESILPPQKALKEFVPKSFILYKPKDIVSGDFYWFTNQKGKMLIATVDCTGHGVPGAFVSMIGNMLLNEIVIDRKITQPNTILNMLHQGVKEALGRDEDERIPRDGMDIGLCCIDTKKNTLHFAGAIHPLYLVRKKKKGKSKAKKDKDLIAANGHILQTVQSDKFSIGDIIIERKNTSFSQQKIKLQKGDTFYMCSDGYEDQFGGEDNEKFTTKRLQKLFLEIQSKPMEKQAEVLEETFETWKGENRQIDDMLVMGLRYE